MRIAVTVVMLAGCGRLGFDPLERDGSGPDASGSDGGTGCMQAAPFLHVLTPREEGSSSVTVPVTWCSAGVSGPLTAELVETDRITVRSSNTVTVADGACTLLNGSGCSDCFVRLRAGGLVVDGPPGDHVGD